jgi:GT2 family glycosyltransferase
VVSYGRFPSARNILAQVLPDCMGAPNRIGCVPAMDQTHVFPVDIMTGADLMFRRAVFASVGLLDEQFFMYFEDADWCYRAKRLGWDICYVPSVRYVHYGIASSVGLANRQWVASLGLLLRKHYHGAQFSTCWLLWQLLRAKHFSRMVRRRVQRGLSHKSPVRESVKASGS